MVSCIGGRALLLTTDTLTSGVFGKKVAEQLTCPYKDYRLHLIHAGSTSRSLCVTSYYDVTKQLKVLL